MCMRHWFLAAWGVLALAGLSACLQPPTPLPPLPTDTPQPAATQTPTTIPSPTPRSFAIQDKAFQDYEQDCQTDVNITGVNGDSLQIKVNSTISMINGNWAVFCYGAKHTWIGVLTYEGYTFASDADDPLQFQVTASQGYVYIKGIGTVTMPDGTQVNLPNDTSAASAGVAPLCAASSNYNRWALKG